MDTETQMIIAEYRESTYAILNKLIAKSEVLRNIEAEANRQAEIYALGVARMSESRAVYE